MESPQLAARNFWTKVEHPELRTTLTYPGGWAVNSVTTPGISRRAPLIGEHNPVIYEEVLNIPQHDLENLKQKGII